LNIINREYKVSDACELLTFLTSVLPAKEKSNAKALLKYRAVYVNGVCVSKYNRALLPGQIVSIQSKDESQRLILYEDAQLLVIDKPAGLLTVAAQSGETDTAYYMMTSYVQKRNPGNRLFVVHRLDRDTSGVLLFAKTESMKHLLQDNWSKLVVTRGYTAVLEGTPLKSSGVIRSKLQETQTHIVYESVEGQEAITQYRVLQSNDRYSLVDIRLQTGRKNQIRVHMKGMSHPVVGDKKYPSTLDPLHRLGLHAHLLEIEHPVNGKMLSFSSEVPHSFTALFSK
jgi:23S rRNA pseudouridine1911/1915/1917 synthase